MTFEVKDVAGKKLLYVMAADAEYGRHLASRFSPVMVGVGPVEAAVALTRTLAELQAENNLPDLVVSLGSAGSALLEQAEVYQTTSVAYRDMDASPFGFPKGETPFLGLPAVMTLSLRVPGVKEASLSTGGNVVAGAVYETIEADMVDMETYAVLRACQSFRRPMIGLRGISDGKKDVSHVGDWTEYLHIIDEKLSRAVDALEEAVADGRIAL